MTLQNLRGRVAWIFEEPDKIKDPVLLAEVAMKEFDPDFAKNVRPGDVLIGGENFGYGHPHYPPMIAMRQLGLAGVISESFSPGYWRGEIAMGFPQAACPGILGAVSRWDEIELDWEASVLRNLTTGAELPCEPLSAGDRMMLAHGGLIGYLHARDMETTT
jgi:3-isopropylmalate/(R)-2-methylmalate dehydratase small subunit